MKVSFVSPKSWAIRLPSLAARSALQLVFLFYSTLVILIYTKILLYLTTVCPSGPCIKLPIRSVVMDYKQLPLILSTRIELRRHLVDRKFLSVNRHLIFFHHDNCHVREEFLSVYISSVSSWVKNKLVNKKN